MKASTKFDEWFFAKLLRGSRELSSYRRDALETYRDLRRDAKVRRGFRGVAGNFIHAVLRAVILIARERFAAYGHRSPRKPRHKIGRAHV